MKTNLILLLPIFIVLTFGSCTITYTMKDDPSKHSDHYMGERPIRVSTGFSDNVWVFFISNLSGTNAKNIMSRLYLEECELIFPFGRRINLLDRDIEIIYAYRATEKITGIPHKILLNVQPQIIEGKRVMPIEGISDGDLVAIHFNEISSTSVNFYGSANSFRLKYIVNYLQKLQNDDKTIISYYMVNHEKND